VSADDSLLDAAQAERDRRQETFPAKILDLRRQLGLIDESSPEIEALTIDYQCWCAIVGWLETDRFDGFYGGTEPHGDAAPYISWPEIEGAAKDALAQRSRKIAALDGKPNVDPETLGALRARRACLVVIHAKIGAHRRLITELTASLQAEARERAAAPEKVAA
jgi:hypothetical protein